MGRWLYEVVKAVVGRKRVLTSRSRGSRGAMEERAMVEAECWHGVGVSGGEQAREEGKYGTEG